MIALRNQCNLWPDHPGKLPVINRWGDLVRWESCVNTVGNFFYPSERIIKTDWTARPFDPNITVRKPLNKWPTNKVWEAGVGFEGRQYFPHYLGSSMKSGISLGVETDFVKSGTLQWTEQLAYMSRYLISNALWGGVQTDPTQKDDVFTMLVVPGKDNKMANGHSGWESESGHMVYDGGTIGDVRLMDMGVTDHKMIHLDALASNYMVSQWLPPTIDVVKDVIKLIDRFLDPLLTRSTSNGNLAWAEFAKKQGELSKNKAKFLDAWPEMMASHPSICETVGISQSRLMAAAASSIPFEETLYKLCLPAQWGKDRTVMFPGYEGTAAVGRIPQDSPSTRVIELDDWPSLWRFCKVPVSQTTIGTETADGQRQMFKDVIRWIPHDEMPKGVDFVVSLDDQKLGVNLKPGLYQVKGAINFMTLVDEDSTCLCNPINGSHWWGADFDGDCLFALFLEMTR